MRFSSYLIFVCCVFFTARTSAQCGLIVDAGPDAASCPGGGQVQLNASISGPNVTGFSWSPLTGLNDPSSLNPVATVAGDVTYTLTAEVFDPNLNLIVNGDFSAGDSDFTTDYSPASGGGLGPLTDEAEYLVTTNSGLTHNNFANCTDHTTGSGQMMVVNGSSVADDNIWCQNVNVDPNTVYAFNAWATAVISQAPAQLQFFVNGTPLGSVFNASSTVCNWQQFSETWTSGSATTAEICITNQNTEPSGNDFAIDDLFFGPVCVQTDEVSIREVVVEAMVVSPVELNCMVPTTAQLDGSGSSAGALYFYEWTTTNGNIVSGANTRFPTVDQPGTYVLTTLYDDGMQQCLDQATVIVQENQTPTEAGALISRPLNCNNDNGELTAEGSSTGPDIVYSWTTADGNIVSGANAFNVVIDQPGFYELDVTNTTTGCSDFAFVDVSEDNDAPVLFARPTRAFSCVETDGYRLDASSSMTRPDFTAIWTTADGNIVSDGTTLNPLINTPGTYVLTVVNNENGCRAMLSVTVEDNTPEIIADIVTPLVLNCIIPTTQLNGAGSTATFGSTYSWSTADGNIVSDGDTPAAIVDEPGTYVLVVRDPSSGCSDVDSVTVLSSIELPEIALQSPPPFTCARAQITLDADGTSTGNDLTYLWSASNGGSIISGGDSLAPVVMGVGDYHLLVRNPVSGCERDTTFSIGEDTTAPEVEAGTGFTLSCGSDAVRLNGTESGTEDDLAYAWSTPDGNFVGATDTLEPLIDAAGTYTLEITDTTNGCFATDVVVILGDNSAPVIDIAGANTLTCRDQSLVLDASGSATGASLVRMWTTANGNFVSGTDGLTPVVDAPGTYVLTISNPTNDCSATRSVTVIRNIGAPPAEAGATITLNCTATTGRLLGNDGGGGFSYHWTTFDGQITASPDSIAPQVSAAGRYYLTVTNDTTGCTAIDSVDVLVNDDVPAIDIGQPQALLTCRDSVLQLNENGTPAENIRYAWTSTSGNILSGENTPSPAIDAPGAYRLTVTDTINGCATSAAVTVIRNTTPPTIDIAPPVVLNCEVTMLDLNAGNSDSGAEFSFSWATLGGNILGGADGPAPSVDAAGDYLLTLTNDATGCTNTDTVSVRQDTLRPVALIRPTSALTCRDSSRILDGSQSDNDLEFDWVWSTSDGNFVGDVTGLMPTINTAGTYALTVRNLINRCTAEARVEVESDDQLLVISAAAPDQLNCLVSEVEIIAFSSNGGENAEISWSSEDGNIVAGGGTLSPAVDAPGTYVLTVLNPATLCMSTLEVEITEDLSEPVVDLGEGFDLGCDASPIRLGARTEGNGPFTYAWSSADGMIQEGGTTSRPAVQGGGTYAVTVTSEANGCFTVADVTLSQNLLLGFDADPTVPRCSNPFGSIEFTDVDGGTAPILYSIDGGVNFTTQTLNDSLSPGSYNLVIQDANGCELMDVVNIPPPPQLELFVDPTAVISLGDAHFINTQTNFADSSLTQITWTPTLALDCADCLRPTAMPDRTTTYVIEVMSSDGCVATNSLTVIVDVRREIYFPTGFSPNGDGINDVFLPFANLTRVVQVQDFTIFDRWGETVFNGTNFLPNDPASGWDGRLDGEPMNPAVFVFSATIEFLDGRVEVFKGDVVLLR